MLVAFSLMIPAGCFDEHPEYETDQSLSRCCPFTAEVVKCLLHALPEALAVRPRIEAEQFPIPVPVSRDSVFICHGMERFPEPFLFSGLVLIGDCF